MTKGVKAFSVLLGVIATLWLVLGVGILFGEKGRALFIEIFLPILGAMLGLWIIVYAISIKSWRFFWLWFVTLLIIWIGLWSFLD